MLKFFQFQAFSCLSSYEKDIQTATHCYWDFSSDIDDALKKYISKPHSNLDNQSLLQAELAYARKNNNLPTTTCQTLVMLVGFSLEPLLQSVCAYQPQKVVLLLNKDGYLDEEWHVFAGHITKAIKQLHAQGLISAEPIYNKTPHPYSKTQSYDGCPTPDNPEGVFQTLMRELKDETDVVIDVTGGKKSMVSGAFMYAAYTGVRISYVDFSQYHSEKRRPYGYSCKIGELESPYQKFALREWERVRSLYENYQFREACRTVESLQATMMVVFPEAQAPIEKLMVFLQYYEAWDSGNYQQAKNLASSLGDFIQPQAVTALGNTWPDCPHFYADPNLHVYVCDELARIQRLIEKNEDYRSAFLRAGGLSEIVMLARLVALKVKSGDKSTLLTALDAKTPNASGVFKVLIESSSKDISVGSDRKSADIFFSKAPSMILEHPKGMCQWWKKTSHFNAENGWDDFLTQRNNLIHKYHSVSRELAEDALLFVTANIEDFYSKPVAALNVHTSAMCWSELCEKTGLNPFLPPNLR